MLFEYQIFIAIILYLSKNGQCQLITFATTDVLVIILKYMSDHYK